MPHIGLSKDFFFLFDKFRQIGLYHTKRLRYSQESHAIERQSTQQRKAFANLDALKCPHKLKCLNIQSPMGGSVWGEPPEHKAYLGEVGH